MIIRSKKLFTRIILLMVLCIFCVASIYKLQGPRIYKIDTNISENVDKSDSIYSENVEIFVIQNPPKTNNDLIELIENFNIKNNININALPSSYGQSFYRESYKFNRFYKPYKDWSGIEFNVLYGNFPKGPEIKVEYIVKLNIKGQKNNTLSNTPHFIFFEKGESYYYYPNKSSKSNSDFFKNHRTSIFEK